MVAQARHGGALVDRRLRPDGAGHRTADRRLGDHLALHPPSRPGRDGRARRPGGGRARALHRRLRHLEDLPQQHEAGRLGAGDEAARAHARLGRDRARRLLGRALRVRRARRSAPTCPRCSRRRMPRAGTCPSTWPRPHR